MVTAILVGALMGVVTALGGWLKSIDPKNGTREAFDVNRSIPVVVVGAAVGAWSGWKGDDLSSVESNVRNAGLVLAADLGLKAGWRNILPIIRNVVRSIKGA